MGSVGLVGGGTPAPNTSPGAPSPAGSCGTGIGGGAFGVVELATALAEVSAKDGPLVRAEDAEAERWRSGSASGVGVARKLVHPPRGLTLASNSLPI